MHLSLMCVSFYHFTRSFNSYLLHFIRLCVFHFNSVTGSLSFIVFFHSHFTVFQTQFHALTFRVFHEIILLNTFHKYRYCLTVVEWPSWTIEPNRHSAGNTEVMDGLLGGGSFAGGRPPALYIMRLHRLFGTTENDLMKLNCFQGPLGQNERLQYQAV